MTFKWKITLPPFHGIVAGAEVMRAGIETEFETGSIGEAYGIFQDNASALSETFGDLLIGRASDLALNAGQGEQTGTVVTGEASGTAAVETDKERKARERKEKKNNNDPANAKAPDPVTIPGAEAPPTVPATGGDGIPAEFQRTAAPPPPPPAATAPPPPPNPPAAPPTGVLAGKIAAELDRRATGAADGGQALADWLATSGITVKGATYTEAVTVLRLQADEKLGPIATALGVAA